MPSWCCAKATTAKSIPTRPFMRTTMSRILALPVTCANVTFGASFWPVSPLISVSVIRRRTRIARDLSRLSLKTPAEASTSTAPWLRRGRCSTSSVSAVLLQHLSPTDVPIYVLAAYGLISRTDDQCWHCHVVHYRVPMSERKLTLLGMHQSKIISLSRRSADAAGLPAAPGRHVPQQPRRHLRPCRRLALLPRFRAWKDSGLGCLEPPDRPESGARSTA